MRKMICSLSLGALLLAGCNQATEQGSPQAGASGASGEVSATSARVEPVARAGAAPHDVANVDLAKPRDATQTETQVARDLAFKAQQGNVGEQVLSGMVHDRSENPKVEEAASMISRDHGQAQQQLRLAGITGLDENPSLSAEHAQAQVKLTDLKGAEFDKAYIDVMVADHEKDLKLYKEQATKAPTSGLRNYFSQHAPTIENHLTHCRQLQQQL